MACPNCGETVYVSEDDLDAGEANCAHCGVTFEVALEDEDEEQMVVYLRRKRRLVA